MENKICIVALHCSQLLSTFSLSLSFFLLSFSLSLSAQIRWYIFLVQCPALLRFILSSFSAHLPVSHSQFFLIFIFLFFFLFFLLLLLSLIFRRLKFILDVFGTPFTLFFVSSHVLCLLLSLCFFCKKF